MGEETASVNREGSSPPAPATDGRAAKNTAAQKGKGPRKRTKTGCLTCRKRRIKCGEEKPRCNNCIKSKRECEGYGQRVVFRPPVGAIPRLGTVLPVQEPGGVGNVAMMSSAYVGSVHHSSRPLGTSTGRPALLPIAPRPRQIDLASGPFKEQMLSAGQTHGAPSSRPDDRSIYTGLQQRQLGVIDHDSTLQTSGPGGPVLNSQFTASQSTYTPEGFSYGGDNAWQQANQYTPDISALDYYSQIPPPQQSDFNPPSSIDTLPSEYKNIGGTKGSSVFGQGSYGFLTSNKSHGHNHDQDEFDELYDVNTDDELDDTPHATHPRAYKADPIAARYQRNFPLPPFAQTASQSDFLIMYRPSPLASPLMDPEVAYILSHFMKNVGATISTFDQRPAGPRAVLPGLPVALDQQGLWTFTFPMMALENQGLLHAILAYSSHNLAKTTNNQNSTAAFRHYHYAIRRVSKAVSLPHRRQEIATLAATLLLALFEVMGADHTKWNSHVAGAAYLIRELNFKETVRNIRSMRARAREEQAFLASQGISPGAAGQPIGTFFENDVYCQTESDIDMDLISIFMGWKVNYDEVNPEDERSQFEAHRQLSPKEIEDYRIRVDLIWWYRKQDMFQAMISGNPLLTPFSDWDQCPPRAAVGRLDAVYGTVDHLILLLARLTTFNLKDRSRKLKVMERNGGEWRPPPGLFPGGPPGGPPPGGSPGGDPQGAHSTPNPPKNPQAEKPAPPMFGMIPTPSRVRLPAGFQTAYPSAPSPTSSDDSGSTDLETKTAEAEAEWHDIKAAFELFESSLGPGLAPLPPEIAPPTPTPFGPSLQYRTHIIGCVWGFYYTGLILLERSHPSMPPAAMMAASVAAGKTAHYAQLISRIVGGIPYQQQPGTPANPSVIGMLTEHIINIFFAAIQYDDAAQREWTISKLKDYTRITGGNSPTAVAHGCETAWIRRYEAGRGPPYERTMDGGKFGNEARLRMRESETRFVTVTRPDKLHMAMGILSLEQDVEDVEEDE